MQEMAEKTRHKFDIEMMKWSANLGVFLPFSSIFTILTLQKTKTWFPYVKLCLYVSITFAAC